MNSEQRVLENIQSWLYEPPREFSPVCNCGHKEEDHQETLERDDEDEFIIKCICSCQHFVEHYGGPL